MLGFFVCLFCKEYITIKEIVILGLHLVVKWLRALGIDNVDMQWVTKCCGQEHSWVKGCVCVNCKTHLESCPKNKSFGENHVPWQIWETQGGLWRERQSYH